MECGTNDMEYFMTITAKTEVSPSANQNWRVYVMPIKAPVENSTGFYYYWGLHDALFTVLKCHSDCGTCTGPNSTQCKTCSTNTKVAVNGSCVCDTSNNYFYAYGDSGSDACRVGCPDCTYTAGSASTGCYYKDYVTRTCVNPPTHNCSAPYPYASPYELSNNHGSCVHNCSSLYAI